MQLGGYPAATSVVYYGDLRGKGCSHGTLEINRLIPLMMHNPHFKINPRLILGVPVWCGAE